MPRSSPPPHRAKGPFKLPTLRLGLGSWRCIRRLRSRFLEKTIQYSEIKIERIADVRPQVTFKRPQLIRGRFRFTSKIIQVELPAHQAADHLVIFAGGLGRSEEHTSALQSRVDTS